MHSRQGSLCLYCVYYLTCLSLPFLLILSIVLPDIPPLFSSFFFFTFILCWSVPAHYDLILLCMLYSTYNLHSSLKYICLIYVLECISILSSNFLKVETVRYTSLLLQHIWKCWVSISLMTKIWILGFYICYEFVITNKISHDDVVIVTFESWTLFLRQTTYVCDSTDLKFHFFFPSTP